MAKNAKMSDNPTEVVLLPEDIDGASVSKPYDKHTIPALRRWLLCEGIKVASLWKKKDYLDR